MTQFIGIADCLGLESLISLPEKVLEAELAEQNGQATVDSLMNMLSVRAQANRQRHAVNFRVEVDEADAVAVKWLLDASRRPEALIKLKKCAKNVEVGKHLGMKKSWRLIPNPDLNPFSD